jgi:four helix bundle protein
MATVKKFEDLKSWQLACVLCKEFVELKNKSELNLDYKLWNQINAPSGSVMDNIAEGFERDGNAEFLYFLSIAKGSAGELRSQLFRVYECKYCTGDKFEKLNKKCQFLSAMIGKFMIYLRETEIRGNKFK